MPRTIADVMTTEVASVSEETGYREIVRTLLERNVSALPVVGASGRVLGVVSEQDLLHKEEFKDTERGSDYRPPLRARLRSRLTGTGVLVERSDEKAAATTAARLMSSPAITTTPDSPLVEAARLMELRGVKRLPVVDGEDRPVGMVARRDLLRVFLQDDETVAEAVKEEIGFLTRTVRGSDLSFSVADGTVTVTGSVHHRSTAHTLGRLLRRIEGVVAVEDKVTWEVDDLMPPYSGL
ncbi:CBS domain-containing protein [Nocardiopsis baichengensis]|uniref:CBS domain-containing protein n=1 Tax=Nocardiopsis baichengensis TaxID=280240 RepID=UPI00034D213A|nr:CBS domain-containing protein [Nocardiopsis baichengensis]